MARKNGERLSRQQETAVSALLTSLTYDATAAKIGVHPNTIRAWMRLPAFAQAYETARKGLLNRTIGRLQHGLFAVTDSLVKDLGDPLPEVRHKAAELLMSCTARMTEIRALKKQLADLKQSIASQLAN